MLTDVVNLTRHEAPTSAAAHTLQAQLRLPVLCVFATFVDNDDFREIRPERVLRCATFAGALRSTNGGHGRDEREAGLAQFRATAHRATWEHEEIRAGGPLAAGKSIPYDNLAFNPCDNRTA